MRPTLFNYIATREEFEKYGSELFKLMSEDNFITRIHKIYPLNDVARAHNVSQSSFDLANAVLMEMQDLEGRKTMGKLLLTP